MLSVDPTMDNVNCRIGMIDVFGEGGFVRVDVLFLPLHGQTV